MSAPVSPTDITQFQRAAVIRDLFFASGSTTIAVRFDITPVELEVEVFLGHRNSMASVTYALVRRDRPRSPAGTERHDERGWSSIHRRAVGPASSRRPVRGRCSASSAAAPLQQAGSPERYLLDFSLGERSAAFEIRAGSV